MEIEGVAMYNQAGNIGQDIDQVLAFIEMVMLIFFYLLTTITIVKLVLKDKFKVNRPFKDFRWVGLLSILIVVFGVAYYLMTLPGVNDMWIKLFIISLLSSLFPVFTLLFSSLIFAFMNNDIFRGVGKLVTIGAMACILSFLVNQSIYVLLPLNFLMVIIITPVVEEVLKYLSVLLFKNKGLLIKGYPSIITTAFAIGAGFSFIENLIYFSVIASPLSLGVGAWVSIILNRTYITATAHGLFVMMTILGFEKKLFSSPRNGLIAAIIFHSIFNYLAVAFQNIYAKEIIVGVASLIVLLKLLEVARSQSSRYTNVYKY
ncbi:PrsW family intramembrane metalloprotease [Candidatus Micrarchaeota archaeon]|nr:PrsW family intramembrane metalloprotease [Candidatus Micrarchaeota archaeon]